MGRTNRWRSHIGGLWFKALGWVLDDRMLVMRGEFDLLHARWDSRGITRTRRRRPALSKVAQ